MNPVVRISQSTAIFGLLLLSLTACTTNMPQLGSPQAPYPFAAPPQVGDIYHLPTGVSVTPEQMLAVATDSRVVFVGETHDNPASHRLELDVLRAMSERWPGQVSLGLEMFNTDQQEVLDRWVSGELSEKQFLKESRWYALWSMDFAYYRDILVFARDQRIPVIGLNATKELVKAVGSAPLEEQPAEILAQLPEMDLDDPYQKAMTAAVFADHQAGENRVAGFQRVQTLWDEQMAQAVVAHLQQTGPDRRMVVMAGGNHVRHGFGIPRRVFRRMPVSYVLVGSREIEIPAEKQSRVMDIDAPDYPNVPYDFMVYTAYESLPGDKVKLGVRMDEVEGRVVVKGVVTGSAAEAAGVAADDIIVSLGGVPIEENFDLVYEVGQRQAGDSAELVVERQGETLILDVTFAPISDGSHHK